MEDLQPGAAAVCASAAPAASRKPFAATRSEALAALFSYPLAYLYVRMFDAFSEDVAAWAPRALLGAFFLGFVVLTAYLHRETPRPRESLVWLGCAAVVLASILLERGRAWEDGLPFLFLHIFAVWWALCRSGALLEGRSGRLLPLDACDGFFLFPFAHFFLRIRTAAFALSRLRGEKKRPAPEAGATAWTAVIAAAALGLFVLAANLLGAADNGFAALLERAGALLRFDWQAERLYTCLFRLLASLPVGAYLYGLLGGALREDKDALRRRAEGVDGTLALLRGVPERAWLALLALFCALYALFFAVQGRYLFGAFTRTLPEGFIVSEYARQGFFELCKVMAVNFALLWLALRSSRSDVRGRPALRALCLALLAESLLLAVVALSKLALYISCFGFTPRRLQSTWLACVLAAGCVCAGRWLCAPPEPDRRGLGCFRAWMVFGAVTLSLLCLY